MKPEAPCVGSDVSLTGIGVNRIKYFLPDWLEKLLCLQFATDFLA